MTRQNRGYFSMTDVLGKEAAALKERYYEEEDKLEEKDYFVKLTNDKESMLKSEGLNVAGRKACTDVIFGTEEIDVSKFNDKYKKNFWDPRLFFYLSCMTTTSVNLTYPYEGDNAHLGIREFWNDLKDISGGGGAQGAVYEVRDEFARNYALKSSKDRINSRAEIIHEMFVGYLLATMSFKHDISNFMKTFGFIKICGEPAMYDEKLFYACNLRGDNYYGITEKVSPGTSIGKYIQSKNFTAKGWLSAILQVMLALNTINTSGSTYSHNDLHAENVLLRDSGTNGQVLLPYIFDKKRIYVKTDSIATIIDYGHSFIKSGKYSYGVAGLANDGTYYDRANPIKDAFKLLMFSSLDVTEALQRKVGNTTELNKVYGEMKKLFTFFNTTDKFEDVINLYYSKPRYLYGVPRTNNIVKNDYTHQKYINYIFKTLDLDGVVVTTPGENDKILSCDGGKCVGNNYKPPMKLLTDGRALLRTYSVSQDVSLIEKYKDKLIPFLEKEIEYYDNQTNSFNEFYNNVEEVVSNYREVNQMKLRIKQKMEGNIFNRFHAYILKKYNRVTDEDVLKLGAIPAGLFNFIEEVISMYNYYLNMVYFRDSIIFLYINIKERYVYERGPIYNKFIVSFNEIRTKLGVLLREISDYISRNRLLIELAPRFQYENERRVSAKYSTIKRYQLTLYNMYRRVGLNNGYEGDDLENFIKEKFSSRYTDMLNLAEIYNQYRVFKGIYPINRVLP